MRPVSEGEARSVNAMYVPSVNVGKGLENATRRDMTCLPGGEMKLRINESQGADTRASAQINPRGLWRIVNAVSTRRRQPSYLQTTMFFHHDYPCQLFLTDIVGFVDVQTFVGP